MSWQEQLRFLTNRYDGHAPWWQFAIWGRQIALEVLVVTPELFAQGSDAHETAVWVSAGLAAVVLLASFAWTRRLLPFSYRFQVAALPRPYLA